MVQFLLVRKYMVQQTKDGKLLDLFWVEGWGRSFKKHSRRDGCHRRLQTLFLLKTF
jgi:hypothetical protein